MSSSCPHALRRQAHRQLFMRSGAYGLVHSAWTKVEWLSVSEIQHAVYEVYVISAAMHVRHAYSSVDGLSLRIADMVIVRTL